MLKASVIISTYNSPEYLKLVLNALKDQDVKNFEVIIADDGSTSSTHDLIKDFQAEFPVQLKHVWHEDNGFRLSTIRNKAVAAANHEYLIFLDGDCIPLSNFVSRHLLLAEKGWFVAGKRSFATEKFTDLILENKIINIHKFSLWQWFWLCQKQYCNRFFSFIYFPFTLIRKRTPKKWLGAQTCNLAVWQADFLAVNGFDENYHGWGYDDSDLVIRLVRNKTFRKDGNHAVTVIHLWHLQSDRGSEVNNLTLLNKLLQSSGRSKAQVGMDQYIK